MQVADDTETILNISFHTYVAHMVDERILTFLIRSITARAYAAGGESTYAVGAADIELLGIRSRQRISVRPYHSSGNA